MVEIRVAVADAAGVHAVAQRLTRALGRSSVSFDGPHDEVRVRSEGESRTVVLLLDAVEALASGRREVLLRQPESTADPTGRAVKAISSFVEGASMAAGA